MGWPPVWFYLKFLVFLVIYVAAQDDVIDSANNQIQLTGEWESQGLPDPSLELDISQIRNGTWLYPSRSPDSITPSLSYAFLGSAVVVVGIIVRGVSQQPLGISVQLDDEDAISPSYSPTNSASNGIDYSYQVFSRGRLSSSPHTVTITVTNTTSPFLFDAIVIRQNPTQSSASSTTVSVTPTVATEQSGSSENAATLGGAIGGGIAAIILVIVFIWFFYRRVKRKEARQSLEAPRPFFDSRTVTTSATATQATHSKGPPSSANQSAYQSEQPGFNAPPPSEISLPSDFHPMSPTYQPTAVASSNLGTVALPPVDPPRKGGTSRMPTIFASNENLNATPMSTASALGLFSDAPGDQSRGQKTLSRPLPLVPGTNRVSSFSIPDEKKGLPLPLGVSGNSNP